MTQQATHQMQLRRTHASGAEEWRCTECERHFVVQWPPHYKKIVLVAGDADAIHTGGKGGLMLSAQAGDDTPAPDLSSAWLAALDELDLDDWLDGED